MVCNTILMTTTFTIKVTGRYNKKALWELRGDFYNAYWTWNLANGNKYELTFLDQDYSEELSKDQKAELLSLYAYEKI
jgi:hypothetical protein